MLGLREIFHVLVYQFITTWTRSLGFDDFPYRCGTNKGQIKQEMLHSSFENEDSLRGGGGRVGGGGGGCGIIILGGGSPPGNT